MLDYELPLLSATILSWIASFATNGRVRTHAWKIAAVLTTTYAVFFQPYFLVRIGILKPLQAGYMLGFKELFLGLVDTSPTMAQTSLFITFLSFVLHYIKPRQRELVLLEYLLAAAAGFLWFSIFMWVLSALGPFPVS